MARTPERVFHDHVLALQRGFSSLEALVAWLRKETGCAGEGAASPEASEGEKKMMPCMKSC